MGKASGGSRGRGSASTRSSAQTAPQAPSSAIRHLGDVGEGAFLHKALSLGFTVAFPFGHVHRYDFIVESGQNLWRVQVKTGGIMRHGLYHLSACRRADGAVHPYNESEIDFLAAFILPEQTWYILPAHQVAGHSSLLFRSTEHPRIPSKRHPIRDLYAYYREAWHLLRQPDGLTF
jgi:hypothetical protein